METQSTKIKRLEDIMAKLEKVVVNNRHDCIEEIRIHDRAKSALLKAGYTTVGSVIDAGVENLIKLKNVGVSTVEKLLNEIYAEYTVCPPLQLQDIILHAAKGVKNADVVMMRFGIQRSKPMTLKEIGDERNMTRERVRQIESKAIATILSGRQGKQLRDIVLRCKAGDMEAWKSISHGVVRADKILRTLIKALNLVEKQPINDSK